MRWPAADFTAAGRDIECTVCAVRGRVKCRVLLNGHKCVLSR